MVAIKSKSIDEISAMAEQRLPVPGADVARLVDYVQELEIERENLIHDLSQHMAISSAETTRAIKLEERVRELEGALSAAVEYMGFNSTPMKQPYPLVRCRAALLAKADQEDPV